jgi:enoyl-CoA hydratase/carnithine racemase
MSAKVEWDAGLAVLTVDAPPLNLFTHELQDQLFAALDEIDAGHPRAVLVRFAGRVVTGGVDVKLFNNLVDVPSAERFFRGHFPIVERLEALPCPVLFAAHALCLTWAFEVALGCDLILAGEGVQFGLIEAKVALTPAMGGTQRLAERAGIGRARQLVMTAERYDAECLHAWGVVDYLFPAEGFDAEVRRFASELATGATRAHAATKQVLRAYRSGGVPAADRTAGRVCAALFDTADTREAFRSFLCDGRARPTFIGR